MQPRNTNSSVVDIVGVTVGAGRVAVIGVVAVAGGGVVVIVLFLLLVAML